MSVIFAGARRRSGGRSSYLTGMYPLALNNDPQQFPLPPASGVSRYGSTVLCTIPTYDGSGHTIHPSVVDMGDEWNGFRWWLADTPYPRGREDLENPTIYGSNDRINWQVPAGLTNPLDDPSQLGDPNKPYNSDTELVFDPVSGLMVCFWRYVPNDGSPRVLRARTSADGSTWGPRVDVRPEIGLSPTITRRPDGAWLYGQFNPRTWAVADEPLGPWTPATFATFGSGLSGSPHHGTVKWVGDRYVAIYTAAGHPEYAKTLCMSQSADLTAWSFPTYLPGHDGVLGEPYRPTLLPSTEPGWLDIWHSGYNGRDARVAYTRLPLSALNPIP